MKTSTVAAKAPKLTVSTLAVTDPRRKLSRDEWASLSKEQKAERKVNRQKARGPVKNRITKLVLRYAARFERMEKAFENDKPIQEAVHDLVANVRSIASDIDELPDTWAPAGRKPSHTFTPGMRVQLVESKLAHYAELLGEDIGEMAVINVAGRRVVVKTIKGGVRLFLEARHIKAAPQA